MEYPGNLEWWSSFFLSTIHSYIKQMWSQFTRQSNFSAIVKYLQCNPRRHELANMIMYFGKPQAQIRTKRSRIQRHQYVMFGFNMLNLSTQRRLGYCVFWDFKNIFNRELSYSVPWLISVFIPLHWENDKKFRRRDSDSGEIFVTPSV